MNVLIWDYALACVGLGACWRLGGCLVDYVMVKSRSLCRPCRSHRIHQPIRRQAREPWRIKRLLDMDKQQGAS